MYMYDIHTYPHMYTTSLYMYIHRCMCAHAYVHVFMHADIHMHVCIYIYIHRWRVCYMASCRVFTRPMPSWSLYLGLQVYHGPLEVLPETPGLGFRV